MPALVAEDTDPEGTDPEGVALKIRRALSHAGVPARQHAGLVATLCGVSVSQARRKLRAGPWLFTEVQAVAQHSRVSLHELAEAPHLGCTPSQPGWCLVDGVELRCELLLGPLLANPGHHPRMLQAIKTERGWLAGLGGTLGQRHPGRPRYGVNRMLHLSEDRRSRGPAGSALRWAFLDDDHHAAEGLADWFSEQGHTTEAFTSPADLLASPWRRADAFVIDFILGRDTNSEALIRHLREHRPHTPIVLLTGRLRDGCASEDTLSGLMRSLNVLFFEKPVRAGLLLAAVLNQLERHHGPPR